MEKAVNALNRAANNNALMNVLLIGCFGALSVRSMNQQREIEALEAEKNSLLKANKGINATIWDWKKHLFAEAEAAEAAKDSKDSSKEAPVVPLSKLKAIYGEVTTPSIPAGDADKGHASKILV
ncbi:hypothetical protein ACH5RR_024276 [Cinchona calisaya]|uniref:Uncharacterized protein n=1 Tax=Cinchona calisaya TaxID=153742 RepID=A0ABD2YW71_9GENT